MARKRLSIEDASVEDAIAHRRLFERQYGELERLTKKALDATEAAIRGYAAAGAAVPPEWKAEVRERRQMLEWFDTIRFCRAKNRPDLALACAVELGKFIVNSAHAESLARAEKFKPGRRHGAEGKVAAAIRRVLRPNPSLKPGDVLKALGWRRYGDRVDGPKEISIRTFENTVSRVRGQLKTKR